jgi:hypothetical protein
MTVAYPETKFGIQRRTKDNHKYYSGSPAFQHIFDEVGIIKEVKKA